MNEVVKAISASLLIMGLWLYAKQRRRRREFAHTVEVYLDIMSEEQFERCLRATFEMLGYEVHSHSPQIHSPAFILKKNGTTITAYTARHAYQVDENSIRELIQVMHEHATERGLFLANSSYTSEAKKLARRNDVTLWNCQKLKRVVLSCSKQR